MVRPTIVNDLADLVLGRQCLGCDTPAPGLCPACLAGLRGHVTSVPRVGLDAPILAATAYEGLGRQLILAYKERGYLSLAAPLGWLLADSVWAAMRRGGLRECVIVPIPSHRRTRRGFDALGGIAQEAVRALRGAGVFVAEERLLRPRGDYSTLKALGRSARRNEVSGAFTTAVRRMDRAAVIVIDDVLTTGATVAEAVHTLERTAVPVCAAAVIAATGPPRGPAISRDRSATNPAPAPAIGRS